MSQDEDQHVRTALMNGDSHSEVNGTPQDIEAATDVGDNEASTHPASDKTSTHAGDDEGDDGEGNDQTTLQTKKKRKKKKPKSQRGLKAATGFEEYYVDPPLTPEEHEEEQSLYHLSRPFANRIEIAIRRYFAKRNLDSDRKNLFDKYLVFGGIEGGPKMFTGGLDADMLEKHDASEILDITAQHSVPFDESDPRHQIYSVDFEGCLKGFLSSYMDGNFDLHGEDRIKNYVGVIRNFLNYLLHHDVCPEYRDQVEAARKICDQAQEELLQIMRAQLMLPGTFNMACSEIFGGVFHELRDIDSTSWLDEEERKQLRLGLEPDRARQVFRLGFAALATEEQVAKYKADGADQCFGIIESEEVSLEVVDITFGASSPATQALYSSEQAKDVPILGKLHAKTWQDPVTLDEDLTEEEERELAQNPPPVKTYEFWIEDVLLEQLSVGMKFRTTVKTLSFGQQFFDQIHALRCSFYLVLPNELMSGWKEVEDEWLAPRPTEDGGMQGDTQGDTQHEERTEMLVSGNKQPNGESMPLLDSDKQPQEDHGGL